MDVPQFVYPLSYKRTCWLLPVWGQLWIKLPLVLTCRYLCGLMFSTHLGKYPSAIVWSYGKTLFGLVRRCQTVLQSSCTVLLPTGCENIHCSAASPAVEPLPTSVLDLRYSTRCTVVLSALNFPSPNNNWCWPSFYMRICHLYVIDKVSV